ncbi:UNVERIFIED_CONTAM: hypothetical protein PYX00_010887 [Menopon gallinae]|uniref:Uncharacterized protein n=1 Tax=Menopon gallinae TaxID=328185 RepID=A0AAW2H6H1_9NEOP
MRLCRALLPAGRAAAVCLQSARSGRHKARSREKGTMLEDEMNRRAIRTVVDLLSPRLFGNCIRVDNRRSIQARQRKFPMLRTDEDYRHMFMFLGYLKRMANLRHVSFAVPHWYTDTHRRKLVDLATMLDIEVESIVRDVAATSLCLVKQGHVAPAFVILDFGYSKTTAGHFSFKNNVLKVERIAEIAVGARDFDDKLISHFIQRNKLEDNTYWREVLMSKIDYLKTILNTTDSVRLHVDEDVVLEISKEEYDRMISEDLARIKVFVDEQLCSGGGEKVVVEVVGGNSNNYAVKAILPKNVGRSLNPSESTALGCSLVSLIKRSKVTFRDISSTYSIKLKGSTVKPSMLFNAQEVPSDSVNVTYKKKEDFAIEVFENETLIGEVRIKVKAEEPVPVTIAFSINRRGLLEACSAHRDADGGAEGAKAPSHGEISVNMMSFSHEELDAIKRYEDEFRVKEIETERIKAKRTEFETLLMGLDQNLRKFGDEFVGYKDLINVTADELLCYRSSKTLSEEEAIHTEFLDRLRPITERLSALEARIRSEIDEMKKRARAVTTKYSKLYTPGLYQLRGELFMIEKWEDTFQLNVETIVSYDPESVETFKKRVSGLLERVDAEAAEKQREEEVAEREKAAQAERARHAEQEAKCAAESQEKGSAASMPEAGAEQNVS